MSLLIKVSLIILIVAGAGVFLFGGLAEEAEESRWVREDIETVSQSGMISGGDLDRFRAVFDEDVKYLTVDSKGGDVYEAVQIGMILKEAKVTVIVRGLCLSSCANYFFTAGEKRIIDGGLVGFHGNATALAADYGGAEELLESSMPFWIKLFYSQESKEEKIRDMRQTIKLEKEFFADLGISQELFDITQLADKGKGDGQNYVFLLPTPSTFAGYGIRNVEGTQNLELKEKLEKEFSERFLYE